MSLPRLNKSTSAAVDLLPYLDLDGGFVAVTVIKQRFVVRTNGRLAPVEGAAVRIVDVPWDDEAEEPVSTRYPSDGGLAKTATDVVVVGSAVRPDMTPAPTIDVRVRVGPVQKELRVFGPRVWYAGVRGMTLSDPEPFESLPVRWEQAWGGSCAEDPDNSVFETRNPLGTGAASIPERLDHAPGPRVEDPRHLISTHQTRPPPAGLAAIGPNFQPRLGYAGTFDQTWQDERMPLLPLDFNPRHNQVATPDLVCPEFLRGGEPVELLNLHPNGPLRFSLPQRRFFVGSRRGVGQLEEHRCSLDTVLIEPSERQLELTWRAVVPVGTRARTRVHTIQVHEKRML